MNGAIKANGLLPLVAQLKACPTQDELITPKAFIETWGNFRQIAPDQGDDITPAMLVGVILFDSEIHAGLLSAAEHKQLVALGQTALERYQHRTNPPNKLGKLLAATIKEIP